jgi:hypothetical protein
MRKSFAKGKIGVSDFVSTMEGTRQFCRFRRRRSGALHCQSSQRGSFPEGIPRLPPSLFPLRCRTSSGMPPDCLRRSSRESVIFTVLAICYPAIPQLEIAREHQHFSAHLSELR